MQDYTIDPKLPPVKAVHSDEQWRNRDRSIFPVPVTGTCSIPPEAEPVSGNLDSAAPLSGTFAVGMGEKFDKASLETLPAGGYVLLPAEMRHFAMATTPSTIQIMGPGPFALNYVNPADDPSKRAPAK